MAIDFLRIADFLQDELQQFFSTVRRAADMATCQAAAARLQAAVNKVEPFAYAPGEEQWRATPESQRWGYLRLESYMGTALHELRYWQYTPSKEQDNWLGSQGLETEDHFSS